MLVIGRLAAGLAGSAWKAGPLAGRDRGGRTVLNLLEKTPCSGGRREQACGGNLSIQGTSLQWMD